MQRPDGSFQKRMRRWESGPSVRFLTFSCYRRLALLETEAARDLFAGYLSVARDKHSFKLMGWVVMPEHVHLLIEPPPGGADRVPEFLTSLKQPVAQRLVASFRKRGVSLESLSTAGGVCRVWQEGGGFDRNVRTLEAYREHLAYIHRNPVERGLVSKPEDWEWSSARWHKGLREEAWGWGGRIQMDRPEYDWGLQER